MGEFIDTWEAINGTKQPGESVSYRRCPLRMISNRWGSVHSTELFILERQRKLLQPVLLAMFSKRMKAKQPAAPKTKPKSKKAAKAAKSDKTDLLLDDDSRESYNIKLSKWASGACSAVLSSLWWLLLEVSQKTRAPLTHLFLWMQSGDEIKKKRGVILELVTHKASAIMGEFQHCLKTLDSWFHRSVAETSAHDLPKELLDMTKSFAAKLVLETASDFYMRIVQLTERFPLKLLWMTLVPESTIVSDATFIFFKYIVMVIVYFFHACL